MLIELSLENNSGPFFIEEPYNADLASGGRRGPVPTTASLPAFNETLFSGQASAKHRCQTSFRR